jgi:uncharacterized BrkB/YihY/UPF0761 family membrane protein
MVAQWQGIKRHEGNERRNVMNFPDMMPIVRQAWDWFITSLAPILFFFALVFFIVPPLLEERRDWRRIILGVLTTIILGFIIFNLPTIEEFSAR